MTASKAKIAPKANKPRSGISGLFSKYFPDWKVLELLCVLVFVGVTAFLLVNYQSQISDAELRSFQVAGVNIISKDKSGASKELNDAAQQQKVKIVINNKTYNFTPKDLGIIRDTTSLADNFYQSSSWLDRLVSKSEVPALKTYVQKSKLISKIESRLGQYKTTKNAEVTVKNGVFMLVPSKAGMAIDFDWLIQQIEQSDLHSDLTIKTALQIKSPEILTKDAKLAKKQAEDLIRADYGIKTDTLGTRFVSYAQKTSWVVFAADESSHSINVSLNNNIASRTMSGIAQSFARPALEKITLKRTDGSFMVIDNGQTGVSLDQATLTKGLTRFQQALAASHPYLLPVKTMITQPSVHNLGTANGGKFVLVDLAKFKAWAINNATVDRTMLVSTGRPGMETPKGHFKILRKTTLVTMKGCNTMVGCWVVPNVPNAQFFNGEGDALHGTYWHNMFGQANLSHGCVNLSLGDAAWLYGWTKVGTDVIII